MLKRPNLSILSVYVGLLHVISSAAQDVFSCGGFIKSDASLDFSRIVVRLYTPEGNLKYETDCAPNNGYYIVPVYSKGHYVIRVHPPDGWQFDPAVVTLDIDGTSDPCSKGHDINFVFTGFTVKGKIIHSGGASGPEGFSLTLYSDTNKKLTSSESDKNGVFEFRPVSPGHYTIKYEEQRWCVAENSVKVVVKDDSVNLKTNVQIIGYSLNGYVVNEGQPVAGVAFVLMATEPRKVRSYGLGF